MRDRQARRQAIAEYNAARPQPQPLPVARDGSRWSRTERKSQDYTKPAKVELALLLMMAPVARTINAGRKFMGYLPNPPGRRLQARAQGYMNHRHMIAEQNLARLKEQQEAQAAATPSTTTPEGATA